MTLESLQSQLNLFDQTVLYEPHNFQARTEALDVVAFELETCHEKYADEGCDAAKR